MSEFEPLGFLVLIENKLKTVISIHRYSISLFLEVSQNHK